MSKAMTAGFAEVLASESARLARLWKVTRTDGEAFHFTDHDQDITLGSAVYKAAQGMVPSAVSYSRSLDPDNLECTVLIDSTEVTRKDLLSGLFDDAEVEVYLVNVDNPAQRMAIAVGWRIGKVTLTDGAFRAELLSKAALLEKNVVEVYSPTCRAHFCDSRCGLSALTYTKTGMVTATIGNHRRKFFDLARTETADIFSYGMLTWTSGANAGRTMEVKNYVWATKEFTLFLPMADDITSGDTYSILQGCSKELEACKAYGNVRNFRGEPFVPGSGVLPIAKDPPKQRHMWRR